MVHLQLTSTIVKYGRLRPSADVNVKTCSTQKRRTKVIHHKHVRQLPKIPDGSTVRIRRDKDKSWSEMGRVVSKHPIPRSYNILNSGENVVRHNCHHLIPNNEPFHVTKEYHQPLCSEGTSNQPQDEATPQSEPAPPPSPAPPPGPLPVTQPSTMETTTTRSGNIIKEPKRYADYHMDKNKLNDLILNLTPENTTQHSRIE